MDATQFFRERIQSLLVRGLGSAEVTRTLGIQSVSEVWGAESPLERPAWYFWLKHVAGAYRLGLEEAIRSDETGEYIGQFSFRYYPDPDEPAFAAFSEEERAFQRAGFLDATGTPQIDRAHEIPDELFTIGVLEYRISFAGEPVEIAFVSMDRLRVRYAEPVTVRCEPVGIAFDHAEGELARNVPAWNLGAPLFACIAGLHAHFERSAPSRLDVEQHPGTEIVRRTCGLEHVPTESAVVGEVVARFGLASTAPSPTVPAALPVSLGPEWWSLATVPHAHRAGCSCCC